MMPRTLGYLVLAACAGLFLVATGYFTVNMIALVAVAQVTQ